MRELWVLGFQQIRGSCSPLNTVDGLVITRSTNDCLDCHLQGDELEEGHVATAVPASHFRNEYTGVATQDEVVGTRYLCLQCHVPQTNAKWPLNATGSARR